MTQHTRRLKSQSLFYQKNLQHPNSLPRRPHTPTRLNNESSHRFPPEPISHPPSRRPLRAVPPSPHLPTSALAQPSTSPPAARPHHPYGQGPAHRLAQARSHKGQPGRLRLPAKRLRVACPRRTACRPLGRRRAAPVTSAGHLGAGGRGTCA